MASTQASLILNFHFNYIYLWTFGGCLQLKYICQEFKHFPAIAHISSLKGLSRQRDHTQPEVSPEEEDG